MSSCFWATVPLRANKGGQQMQPSLSHLNPTIHLWTHQLTRCILWWIFSFYPIRLPCQNSSTLFIAFFVVWARHHLTAAHFYCSALLGSFSCLPLTLVLEYSPTPAMLWHTLGLGDHHRNPNINERDHIVGQPLWRILESFHLCSFNDYQRGHCDEFSLFFSFWQVDFNSLGLKPWMIEQSCI